MIHHEAAILDDFDPGFGEYLGGGIVANARLQPYGLRLLRQNISNVRRDFLRAAKDVYEIDVDRNVDEPTIDLFAEYSRRFRIVNRHRNDLKAGVLKVPWDVECRLTCLSLSFDSEDSDGLCRVQQLTNFASRSKYVLLPIHLTRV